MSERRKTSLWPAEVELEAQLRIQRKEREARHHRDDVAPEGTQAEIDEMTAAAAQAAGLTLEEYQALLEEHHQHGVRDIFPRLAAGEAQNVDEARRQAYQEAGNEASRSLEPVDRAFNARVPHQFAKDRLGKMLDGEYVAEHPRKKRRRPSKAELARQADGAWAMFKINTDDEPPPDVVYGDDLP